MQASSTRVEQQGEDEEERVKKKKEEILKRLVNYLFSPLWWLASCCLLSLLYRTPLYVLGYQQATVQRCQGGEETLIWNMPLVNG